MDWNAAIERNSAALKRVLAVLVAMAGLAGASALWGGRREASDCAATITPTRPSDDGRPPHKAEVTFHPSLPRHLHTAVLRLLRPAEAAARRLIIVAARGLVVALPPPRPFKATSGWPPKNLVRRAPSLPLLDPLRPWRRHVRRPASGVPRISMPGFSEPVRNTPRAPAPDDAVDATRLALRLTALAAALDDLPGRARRFARWRQRRDAAIAQRRSPGAADARISGDAAGAQINKTPGATGARMQERRGARFVRIGPLRPGRPPGWRQKPVDEVHEVLNVVHGLAVWALEPADTS